ncbi:MAG: hypothetical protein JNK78_20695 [Planctomycetes bacterium]|nr:hypothetical protein [Planctomycetota bacterium]
MDRRSLFLGALLFPACSSPDAPPPSPPAPIAETARPSWRSNMLDVGTHHDRLRRILVDGEGSDLRAAADAANTAAAGMRLGYGALEDRSTPGFARKALDAESWLMQVGLEARLAHGDLAREAFVRGSRHCTSCHDCVKKGG